MVLQDMGWRYVEMVRRHGEGRACGVACSDHVSSVCLANTSTVALEFVAFGLPNPCLEKAVKVTVNFIFAWSATLEPRISPIRWLVCQPIRSRLLPIVTCNKGVLTYPARWTTFNLFWGYPDTTNGTAIYATSKTTSRYTGICGIHGVSGVWSIGFPTKKQRVNSST